MNRRNFLNSAAAAAGVLSNLDSIASGATYRFKDKFSLKMLATNWGFQGSLDQFCAAAKKEGYDGVEMWWSDSKDRQNELYSVLDKYDLELGYLCGSSGKDYPSHLNSFRKSINEAASISGVKPLYINCHSGKDFFSFEQNQALIDHTAEVSSKSGIPIYHETHRGRMLFAAHVARQFIEKNPSLRLTLDISHWCNVHESLLQDQQENVKLALSRVSHIHSRVGHEQGPQVNDPRAPEWESALNAHLAWWDFVVEQRVKSGNGLTILAEFGPPNYLPTIPYTNQPLSDQWAINVYMMKMLRKRYII